ncbi:hypothetical protein BV898_12678 [Hypsibius exemplaris]|uniref:Lysosomal dipeptide transporter MFSD1 n=1 Tax=Hypsibius exemplaris TaxID=2072580 RepID=A0A1W0WD66_HYPEX|nr:hypothetical protein BV898_12678 [Hypsibius exemplaris]
MDTRWWILIFCSIQTFTSDFFNEEPSVLVQRLTGTAEPCTNGTDVCLNLDLNEFNWIFSGSNWAAALAAICAGLIIDRYGSKLALLCSAGLLFFGTLIFVLATYSADTTTAFAVLMVGRLMVGLGAGSGTVITHRMKAGWFLYRELALAFSIQIFLGRLGSATSFLLIGSVVDRLGLRTCLWLGFVANLFAAGSNVALVYLDQRGSAMASTAPTSGNFSTIWRFIRQLDGTFWCVVLTVLLYYGTTLTFVANGPNFLAMRYGFSETRASIVTGFIYDIGLLAPLSGWLTDRFGYRQYWIAGTSGFLFIGFLLLYLIPQAPPGIFVLLIGIGYTSYGPTVWSSIPLIVPPDAVGLATGIGKFLQFVGTGAETAGAGAILNMNDSRVRVPWDIFSIYLICMAALCCLACALVVFLNHKGDQRLTPSQKDRDRGNGLQEITPLKVDFGVGLNGADKSTAGMPVSRLPEEISEVLTESSRSKV